MYIRIIPRMDIKGPNLVKGVHLEGLRVMGKPERFARYYYEQGADELIYMDVVASLYGRNSLLHIVERTSREISIPLAVGGGLRSVEDIYTVLRTGADKVSINTAAVKRPEFIREAANRFGSSTIVVSIEAKKRPDGTYEVYTDNGRERTGLDALKWASRVAEYGAGEILLTSIDNEGTGVGFDLELTKTISNSVSIPVIACGGAGTVEDVCEVVKEGRADAVSIASMLHYGFISKHCCGDDYSSEGNVEFLQKRDKFTKVNEVELDDIKKHLVEREIPCRMEGMLNV